MTTSKQWILILEDNDDRRSAMTQLLDTRLPEYAYAITDDPAEFMQLVNEHLDEMLAISLDHDLYDRPDRSTELTGMIVVEEMTRTLRPAFPVILHTTNEVDGQRMKIRLASFGWWNDWVKPFDGTNWVALTWYPALKRAIRHVVKQQRAKTDDVD